MRSTRCLLARGRALQLIEIEASLERQPTPGEILTQLLGVGSRLGERDVAIGPHEVQRIFSQARTSHCLLPREHMQRKAKLGARVGKNASRFAIDMSLP